MQGLRIFCDVADLRSFSRAAELHGITQSAVSQRIQHLEELFGTRLLDRSKRPFVLTPAGELVSREGRELVARYDALARSVSRLDPERGGTVRVHAIYSAGIALLNQLRAEFQLQRPELDVQIEYEPPAAVAEAARTGRCDFGIVSYPEQWPGLRSRPLREERMCLACGVNHELAGAERVLAGDLDGRELIHFTHELPAARHIRSYLVENGAEAVFAQRLDNIDTFKSMLQATDYAAILPLRTFLAEVRAGLLAAVPLEPKLERPMGIVYARGRLRQAAEEFAAFLTENAGPMPAEDEARAERGEAA
ncbi:MAG: LysR family transcriptional regulator [Holophagales bacterium]|nr:LysR family transcriptional regulator [Holophagales bacterium]MXX61876.1 LysR family transcriptional regulator [Holophagales bacterium]MYC11015.1 LysR family transcriptional regulator [Holophagales bacterium]MYD21568.1 LysR family transcriptional regulator [Holophagales bacterium]MYI31764.1 LysR family transcriptional regulator [Holophagales bacterium]